MEEENHVRVKDNSLSIERILRPISYTSWLLGVGVAHPRKCPKAITIIIRIIYMTVCSVGVIYDAIDFFPYNGFDILVSIFCLNKVMCYVSIYYYIYHGIRQNKWPELMDRLKELDQKIRKEISMNNRSIIIVEALAVLVTFTFCPLMTIFQTLYYLPILIRRIFIQDLLFYYTLAQLLINSFVFDVIVYVLYCRFQTINKLIDQLDKLFDVQLIAFKIRHIRELHADICDLARMVNDIHGFHLLICSVNCFTMAVETLFTLYIYIKRGYGLSLIHFSRIVYVMPFCLICWICTLACQESNRTGKIIYKIILNCKTVNLDKHEANNQSNLEVQSSLEDSNGEQNSNCSSSHNLNYVVLENLLHKHLERDCVRNEINDFSTQLQQNRVAFTACDIFEINNASFGCFIGVIFTYLIIFLQFYQSPKN